MFGAGSGVWWCRGCCLALAVGVSRTQGVPWVQMSHVCNPGFLLGTPSWERWVGGHQAAEACFVPHSGHLWGLPRPTLALGRVIYAPRQLASAGNPGGLSGAERSLPEERAWQMGPTQLPFFPPHRRGGCDSEPGLRSLAPARRLPAGSLLSGPEPQKPSLVKHPHLWALGKRETGPRVLSTRLGVLIIRAPPVSTRAHPPHDILSSWGLQSQASP